MSAKKNGTTPSYHKRSVDTARGDTSTTTLPTVTFLKGLHRIMATGKVYITTRGINYGPNCNCIKIFRITTEGDLPSKVCTPKKGLFRLDITCANNSIYDNQVRPQT